jgi:hypothetical protein
VVNLNDQGAFLRNNRGNENNWITFNLVGAESNRDAIGALVKIKAGDREQMGVRRSTTGYLSQNDHRMHFGIGQASSVEFVEIRWPSGKLQRLENLEINQILTITEE